MTTPTTAPFPYDEWERAQGIPSRDFDCGCHFCGRKVGKNPRYVTLDDSHGYVLSRDAAARVEAGETITAHDGTPITGQDGVFPVGPHCLRKHGLAPFAVTESDLLGDPSNTDDILD